MNEEWSFPNEATPPGSGPYYVARFSPVARRDEVAAWFAWFSLIDRAVLQSRDPGVTRLKLDWWHDETERMASGSAQHPLALALMPSIRDCWQIPQMHRLLNAAEDRVRHLSPKDTGELEHQCRDEQASRLHLLAGEYRDEDEVEATGFYIGVVARLQRLPLDLSRGYLSLPLAPDRDAETALQEGQLGATGTRLIETAERGLPADPSPLPAQPRALLAQHRRIARLLISHGCPTRRVLSPSPLGLLWSAWRGR